METESKLRVLNRDVIKYAAMFTMLLNHFATALLPGGTLLCEILEDIGYFTAITMCYFLVEGFQYTRSRRKYGQRLLIFAFLSEVPYVIALEFTQLNMLFTLFFCFMILVVRDKVEKRWKRNLLIFLLILVTVISDWALMAAIFTVMFAKWQKNRKKLVLAYGIAAGLFGLFNFMNFISVYSLGAALLHTGASCLGIAVSGIVLLVFYNGKRAETGRSFSKWFFYWFYPAHLAVLAVWRLNYPGIWY